MKPVVESLEYAFQHPCITAHCDKSPSLHPSGYLRINFTFPFVVWVLLLLLVFFLLAYFCAVAPILFCIRRKEFKHQYKIPVNGRRGYSFGGDPDDAYGSYSYSVDDDELDVNVQVTGLPQEPELRQRFSSGPILTAGQRLEAQPIVPRPTGQVFAAGPLNPQQQIP